MVECLANMAAADQRATIAEVRAWVLASVVILVHTVTVVWWAATLSANFESLKESILRDRVVYADHEQRIRQLERLVKSP